MTTDTDDADHGETALDKEPENRIGTVTDQQLLMGDVSWNGPDYATVAIPDPRRRPKQEWSYEERQADLFRLLRKYGHPDNIEKSQRELGEEYDVSQQQISEDFKRVRKYIAAHVGQDAISMTDLIVNKGVRELIDEKPYQAVKAQLEYMEFLMETGAIDRAPERKEIAQMRIDPDSADELTDEQREQFDRLAEFMSSDATTVETTGEKVDDEPIDVGGGE